MSTMNTSKRGFTLIEILVATAIFAIIMVGILNMLDTSTRLSKVETAVADTQENVRFAAYHIMRTVRMMGGAVLPFAADIGGTDSWVMGELLSNQSGTVATDFGNVTVLAGSDVLTVHGFFEVSPFFIDRSDIITTGTDRVEVRESNAAGEIINYNFDRYDGLANLFEGRGIVFMGNMDQAQYAVGEVGASSDVTGTAPTRKLNINFVGGAAQWYGLNPDGAQMSGPPAFNTYRVGILERDACLGFLGNRPLQGQPRQFAVQRHEWLALLDLVARIDERFLDEAADGRRQDRGLRRRYRAADRDDLHDRPLLGPHNLDRRCGQCNSDG